ncbi:hypothetical protein BGX20_006657 [Mortierella sp. AD010]|nr:hypothetical protein BGX20_006657 [Mortierella sp. AD010]
MSDFQRGLQAFERLVKSDEGVRTGSCRKCGGSGHLTFECRNFVKLDGPSSKPKANSRFGFLKKQLGVTPSPPSGSGTETPSVDAADSNKHMSSSKKGSSSSRHQKKRRGSISSDSDSDNSSSTSSESEDDRRHRKRSRGKGAIVEVIKVIGAPPATGRGRNGVVVKLEAKMTVADLGLALARILVHLCALDPGQGNAVADITGDQDMMTDHDLVHQLRPKTADPVLGPAHQKSLDWVVPDLVLVHVHLQV